MNENHIISIQKIGISNQPGRITNPPENIALKLSSLKRYVKAIGGKLRLDIELPDGSHYGFPV